MGRPLALDLYCRAGGVSEGLRRAGFDVVGVDLLDCSKAFNRGPGSPAHPNPARFVQADALEYPLEGFDLICASPPCQAYTALRALHQQREYADLVAPTRARLEGSGACRLAVDRADQGQGARAGLAAPAGVG
jgi:DNA (cytosine-5)-methyltransferase 1